MSFGSLSAGFGGGVLDMRIWWSYDGVGVEVRGLVPGGVGIARRASRRGRRIVREKGDAIVVVRGGVVGSDCNCRLS